MVRDPASVDSFFQAALREVVTPALKPLGFRKYGPTYVRAEPEAVQVINLQKSGSSTREEIRFAVNLGIALKVLMPSTADAAVRMADCHWARRLAPDETRGDWWWTVRDAESARAAAAEVVQALREHALPRMAASSTNAALRALWSSGAGDGLTEVQRARYLAALVARVPES